MMHWLAVGGQFVVRSAYELEVLGGGLQDETWAGWSRIWQLRVQQCVKVFVWMLGHDRILTNFLRWRRGLSATSDYERCHGEREDALHVIHDCQSSKEVWECFQPPELKDGVLNSDMKTWILQNFLVKDRPSWGGEWPEVMAIICWNVWKWRNGEVFRMEKLPIVVRMAHLKHSVEETAAAWGVSFYVGSGPSRAQEPCTD